MTEKKTLRILISSANIGNAQPTPSSIAAWIPFDGDFDVTTKSKYPISELPESFFLEDDGLPFESKDPKTHAVPKDVEWFDIIAIGMQEATFNEDGKDDEWGMKDEDATREKRKNIFVGDTSLNLSNFDLSEFIDEDTEQAVKEAEKAFGSPLETGKVIRRSLEIVGKQTEKIIAPLHAITASKEHTKKYSLIDHPATTFGGTKILQKLIMKRCPSYECSVHYQRGEMRLLILVRKDIVHLLQDIDCKAGNTGVGSFLPNKGGIKVTLTICKTRLSFVNAHLAAHEGEECYASRCSNITNIFDQTRGEKYPERQDCTNSSHHTFVFGDLNFRIALPNKEEIGHDKHVEEVAKLVSKSDWKTLNANDELIHAVKKGDCMFGFNTLPCEFPPTFKVKRGKGFVYNPQRCPSYTDRILWKSSHGLKADVKPLLYEPVEFETSDHKAIRGAFSVMMKGSTPSRYSRKDFSHLFFLFEDRNEMEPRFQVDIFVSDISFSFLNSEQNMRTFAISMIDPIDLQGQKSFSNKFQNSPRTNVCKRTLEPNWPDEELQIKLDPKYLHLLHGSFLYIMLVQEITGRGCFVRGTAAFDLDLLFAQQHDELKESLFSSVDLENVLITKNGIVQGHLNCEIGIFLSEKDIETSYCKRHLYKKKKKNSLKKLLIGTKKKKND